MDPDITQLAKMMRARRAAGVAPYTLLLGSSLSLTPAVRRAVCDSEDWEAFWETVSRTSPDERRALMHEPLSQLDLHAGCEALAQLVGAGYFNVVLTLNVDDALDNALKTLPASEYRVWVHGEVSSREIVTALDRPTPRIKVVKLHGDVNAYKLPLTPEATFVFPDDLEEALTHRLRHDTVIVGDLPFDDDMQRCISGGDGALWVIAAEDSGFLGRAKRIRKVGEVITATEFNAFFTALAEALGLGEAEEAALEVAFVPPEKRVNPYRGLEPFEPEHAWYFFGREVLTEMLVERLRRGRFLAVLGASGSGKSSVVRAGVLPALAQGQLPGSGNWPVLVIKPGQNPQEALAGTLVATVSAARSAGAVDFARLQEMRGEIQERLLREESALHEIVAEVVDGRRSPTEPDDRRVVVVIDQFEELFTLCPFEQRQRFIDALLYAVRQPEGRTTVLLTLRADFVAQCTAYPDLSDLISSHQVWARAMDDAGLRAAIERPAWLAGMRYEPGLVPLILADVGREPGALPLLEDALWSLFEYCREGDEVIELREYREIGGVQGALAKRADDVYATLSAKEREYTRRILLRLVEMREGQEATRRRATLDELIAAPEERIPVEKVVQRLTDTRLLTTTQDEETGQGLVDISHEALIQGWPRLREWIDEDRATLRTHRRLTEAAIEWEKHDRDKRYFYRDLRLDEAKRLAASHLDMLSESERDFLFCSILEADVDLQDWLPRYGSVKETMALAKKFLKSDEETERIKGLSVLRWLPDEADSEINPLLLQIVLADKSDAVSNRAAEVLCERDQILWFASQLSSPDISPAEESRLTRALGHTRNLPKLGIGVAGALQGSKKRRVVRSAAFQLISDNRAAFALAFSISFGISTLVYQVLETVVSPMAIFTSVRLSGPGPTLPLYLALMMTVGFYALVHAHNDRSPITVATCFKVGLISTLIAGGLGLVGLFVNRLAIAMRFPDAEELQALLVDIGLLFKNFSGTMIVMSIFALSLRTLTTIKNRYRKILLYSALGNAISIVWEGLVDLVLLCSRDGAVSDYITVAHDYIIDQWTMSVSSFIFGTVFLFVCFLGFLLALRSVLGDDSPWLDTWNLAPGKPWQEAIDR